MSVNERGATAVFVAAALVALMGIAAIAVDYSAALNERRQDVGAADTAALGGILEGAVSAAANPLQTAVDEAKSIAQANTPGTITQADWDTCTDPGALVYPSTLGSLGVTNGSQCISFSQDFATIRVRLPDQETPTSFGRVVGVDEITTNATAMARIGSTLGTGGSFPAGVFGGSTIGLEFCIKTGTGGKDTCGDPSTGDFGNFQPYFYTELNAGGISSQCTSGNQPAPLARAMADGLDHALGVTLSVPGSRINGAWCPGPGVVGPPFPNRVDSGSGYSNADVTVGLVRGGNWDGAFSGRLARGPYRDGTASVFGVSIDNRPLWSFIVSGGGLPTSCNTVRQLPDHPTFPVTISGTPIPDWQAAKDLMSLCLRQHSGLLFTSSIGTSARLAGVPQFHQTAPLGSNACCYDVAGFVPIFIESLWTNHGSAWTCNGSVFVQSGTMCRHDAGMSGTIDVGAPGNRRIDSASAFLLRCSHLPDEVCRRATSGSGSATFFLSVELVG